MTFTCQYKNKSGTLVTETIDAASRTECIMRLKARGIVPQAVKEGGGTHSRGRLPCKVLISIFILFGGALVWWLLRPPATVPESIDQHQEKNIKRIADPIKGQHTHQSKQTKASDVRVQRTEVGELVKKKRVLNQPPPPSASNIVIHVGNTNVAKKVFKSATETVLHMLARTVPGDMPPPVPNLPKFEDLKKILETTIVVEKGESVAREIAKENVATLKAHLEEFIKNGGNPDDFVSTYRNWLQECAVTRRDYERMVRQTLKNEGRKQAEYDLRILNAKLKGKGIKQIEIPQRLWNAAFD